jgi:hypothetical protein
VATGCAHALEHPRAIHHRGAPAGKPHLVTTRFDTIPLVLHESAAACAIGLISIIPLMSRDLFFVFNWEANADDHTLDDQHA